MFRLHRWRVLLAYSLFTAESLLGLAMPLVLGLAIRDLLAGSWVGPAWLLAQQFLHLLAGVLRRMYDTRVSSRLYGELASELVVRQRSGDVPVSTIAARSALARQLIDFLERDLPFALQTLYGVLGAVVMLALADVTLVLPCLALLVPAVPLARRHARRTTQLNRALHDELEHEVKVIGAASPEGVREHYDGLGRWRIRLSDLEAINVGVIELLTVGALMAALVQTCISSGNDVGRIAMVLGYLAVFVRCLLDLPFLTAQLARLRDIARRVRTSTECPQQLVDAEVSVAMKVVADATINTGKSAPNQDGAHDAGRPYRKPRRSAAALTMIVAAPGSFATDEYGLQHRRRGARKLAKRSVRQITSRPLQNLLHHLPAVDRRPLGAAVVRHGQTVGPG
jgi:hypothetical protein